MQRAVCSRSCPTTACGGPAVPRAGCLPAEFGVERLISEEQRRAASGVAEVLLKLKPTKTAGRERRSNANQFPHRGMANPLIYRVNPVQISNDEQGHQRCCVVVCRSFYYLLPIADFRPPRLNGACIYRCAERESSLPGKRGESH